MTQIKAFSNGPSFKALFNQSIALVGYISQVSATSNFAHRKLLSESFQNPMDSLPECGELVANVGRNDTVTSRKDEGLVINDQLVHCRPMYKAANWPAMNLNPLVGCTSDRLTLKRSLEPPLHVELEGREGGCKMTHKVMGQAADFEACSGHTFLQAAPGYDGSPKKHYHPEKIATRYGSAIFDPEVKGCARSLLERINARGVTLDAAKITAVTVPFTLFVAITIQSSLGQSRIDAMGASFPPANGNRPSLGFAYTNLLTTTTRNTLAIAAQLAIGGFILDRASRIGGEPNPESEYSAGEGALQGLIGGAAIGALTGFLATFSINHLNSIAGREPGNDRIRVAAVETQENTDFFQFVLNQFVAPALGSALHGMGQVNRQGPKTATLASLSACFASLCMSVVLRHVVEGPFLRTIASQMGGARRAGAAEDEEVASRNVPEPADVSVDHERLAVPQSPATPCARVNTTSEIKKLIDTLEGAGLDLEQLLEKNNVTLSRLAICPISCSIMKDPVIVPSRSANSSRERYSHTFDRASIFDAVGHTGKNPITSERLSMANLRESVSTDQQLRAMILDFLNGVQQEMAEALDL